MQEKAKKIFNTKSSFLTDFRGSKQDVNNLEKERCFKIQLILGDV